MITIQQVILQLGNKHFSDLYLYLRFEFGKIGNELPT